MSQGTHTSCLLHALLQISLHMHQAAKLQEMQGVMSPGFVVARQRVASLQPDVSAN